MSDGEVRYLGDGVYATFDGYQVWLHVGGHNNPPVVAIEPETLRSLVNFDREMRAVRKKG